MLLYLIPALIGLSMVFSPIDLDDLRAEQDEDDPLPEEEEGIVRTDLIEPEGARVLEGSDAAERLVGNDTTSEMLAYGGDDIVLGNGGADAIDAGSGDDIVYGGEGNDFVAGGEGADRVFLGDGNDTYTPDEGGDPYDAGDDFVRGGAGGDLIVDLAGMNTLFGDVGSDSLVAFDGLNDLGVYEDPDELRSTDTLTGGFGNDTLAGDFGDVMTGGADADTFIVLDAEDPRPEQVYITDFDTSRDNLIISSVHSWEAVGAIELTHDETRGGVRASFEGRAVAILQGLTATDIPDINVALTPFEML